MEEREREGRGKVSSLIEKATNSTSPEVDPRLLKAIKSVARYSDSEIQLAFDTLMQKMEKEHSQVRYLALLIIDELFMRSKLFRSLLVVNFDQLLILSVGFKKDLPLPAPSAIATRLRSKAIEYLEKWNSSFGIHYRQIRLGFEYLKNTLNFQFPNLQQNAARREQERREREMRSKEILLNKFETLRQNISLIKGEIQRTIDEIGECLDILHPKEEDFIPVDTEEEFESRSVAFQKIRLESLKEGDKLHETSENKVLFDVLRELYKLVESKHLASLQDWISVLVRVEPADCRFRDSTLKEFIDLRNQLRSVKNRCEGCTLTNIRTDEDEDIWEEVKIDAADSGIISSPNVPNNDHASTFTANENKNKTSGKTTKFSGSKNLDGKGECSDSNSVKSSLLAEAPVMTWGASLDDWGAKRDRLANQRGLEIEGHWGRVDYDAVIPAEKIAELNVQAFLYKEDPVEISPCLAPLKSGLLCQRRDLRVCPFHGPVIPRDVEGNPIDQAPLPDDIIPDLLVEKLAKQAVKNVRERDRDEVKRKSDKHLLKRAKLAKVREHNESVLRDAALASTSYSESVGAANQNGPVYKENKQTLSSMLRKKITPKDRIAKRLLNRRASNATRELILGEDTKYREAYPNQW
ncbi:Uv-stimulated scaffold protein a-like protein [Thalictrum thalictroides]|uniref:Uv-stimulated scaffold protein a-like protein n=1 Tax=Thalictrum thalictroides TaxID=46969 RepID=A0A7J6VBA2_THATH|nr:Uv-stimulated scaffold protein a-like protein [Thalictrum thalictroides]